MMGSLEYLKQVVFLQVNLNLLKIKKLLKLKFQEQD